MACLIHMLVATIIKHSQYLSSGVPSIQIFAVQL